MLAYFSLHLLQTWPFSSRLSLSVCSLFVHASGLCMSHFDKRLCNGLFAGAEFVLCIL